MNVYEAARWDIVSIEVERRITHRHKDSVSPSVQGTIMDAIQVEADSVASQNRSTLTGLFDVSICQILKNGQLDS